MTFKVLKAVIAELLRLIPLNRIKDRVKTNFEYVVNDDEVVLDVFVGFDERSHAFIVTTNKHLYVLGEVVIHKVKKEDILEIMDYKGLMATLIEVQSVSEDPIYFKVYSKRAVKVLKGWF